MPTIDEESEDAYRNADSTSPMNAYHGRGNVETSSNTNNVYAE